MRFYSFFLVFIQLLLIGLLIIVSTDSTLIELPFSVAALIFGLWSMWHLRNQLSALPEPVKGKVLIQTGPYQWVRHPIYFAILLWTLGKVVTQPSLEVGLTSLGLLTVLIFKVRHEEKLLLSHYPGYEQYKKNTKAILPFLL